MRWLHTAVIVILAAAILIFVAQNFQSVTVAFLGLRFSLPLSLLALIIYALGLITGGSVWALVRWAWVGARANHPVIRRTFIHRVAMFGAALFSGAANAQTPSRGGSAMINDMTFEDVRKLLDLTPNATCGYVRVTFISKHKIAAGGMAAPFADGRAAGSALYFMLTPEEPVKLHRIRNDQLYHYYLGDPIEV